MHERQVQRRAQMRIVWHCSASEFGTALLIDKWHRERGWAGVGYHAVIGNGFPDKTYIKFKHDGSVDFRGSKRVKIYNGAISPARALDADDDVQGAEVGAHAYGFNRDTVALCLIGDEFFTRQQIVAGVKLSRYWMNQFGVEVENIVGHGELPGVTKTCPNLDMDKIRALISNKVESMELMGSIENMLDVY